ncbi:hypothetical protein [Peribacillus sp. TH24]|nr:hypothetical protein [Peribacillus sp. TH24]MBK5446037.1 hypothetical protein [Peribacillus sp. TH24]
MYGSSLTEERLKGCGKLKIKSKEWLAMTELDRYMEIYRAYVRNQKL